MRMSSSEVSAARGSRPKMFTQRALNGDRAHQVIRPALVPILDDARQKVEEWRIEYNEVRSRARKSATTFRGPTAITFWAWPSATKLVDAEFRRQVPELRAGTIGGGRRRSQHRISG